MIWDGKKRKIKVIWINGKTVSNEWKKFKKVVSNIMGVIVNFLS